jgi:hypothetical protein
VQLANEDRHRGFDGATTTLASEVSFMPEMSTKKRNDLKDADFAQVDADGDRHLPINDKSHVRNAVSRFGQTDFDRASDKASAAKKVMSAAKKQGVEVGDDTEVAKAAKRKTR